MPPIDYYDEHGWSDPTGGEFQPRQVVAAELVTGLVRGLDPATGPLGVLDVGCGDGAFLAHLAGRTPQRPVRWVGVDYSAHQLAKAARLPYEFHKCDLGEGIPLPDGCMDVVHAAEVIEHVVDPDLLVEEAARVLRPGGHLVVTTPNLHAWYNRLLFLAGIQPVFHETSTRSTAVGAGPLRRLKRDTRPVGHLRLFNRTALLDLLDREGFTPVRVLGVRFPGVPTAVRWLDQALSRRSSLASILVVHAVRR